MVIGGGPAGASTAILLAQAGWRVILAEQQVYPRQKVCGECLTAGSLVLLDELGVGAAVRDNAGPELQRVGWVSSSPTIVADLPPCTDGPYRFGRALGRDQLDAILLARARALGVEILQPAKVRSLRGDPGRFDCMIESVEDGHSREVARVGTAFSIRVSIVIDGHGSWEMDPEQRLDGRVSRAHAPRYSSDLFGFKASFHGTALAGGLLPVLSFKGGYGGMVVAEGDRLTIACCIRRDTLRECRARTPGAPAGIAIEQYLRASCMGVREVLDRAQHTGPWLTVGPLRPGIRIGKQQGPFKVGNAAGEAHPLIGEGINMALHSAFLLTSRLVIQPVVAVDEGRSREIHRDYAAAWRGAFAHRLRLAAAYAHFAMRPALSAPATALLCRWPAVLTEAARWA
ncbi:MAG TPA: FAD-dependent monooxygenase, partial [Candidatus Binataceae bacterium]|nr:FAD-dependent monooxygenase [Candidatus Binataceae bacterium]